MADTITDNRTNVTTAESATNFTDLSGSASGTLDSEIFIQGSNSMGESTTSTRTGLLYNFGATDVSNNTFYVWINCGIVGLLDTKANGGMAIRFAGATATDFFEVYVGGSDDYPSAVNGGWVQFVVDIEEAHTNSDATGGTKPATNQVQRVGYSAITGGTMPRMVDNTWMDQIARLPDATPGIIVQGRSGGTTDWTSADIFTQLGIGVGTFVPTTGGAYKVNTPIRFGANDTVTHGFADSQALWLWDDQEFVPDGFYNLSALGNSGGTTNVDFNVMTIRSNTTGAAWDFDFSDANLDAVTFTDSNFVNVGNAVLGGDVITTGTRWDAADITQAAAQIEGDCIVSPRTAANVALIDDATFGTTTGVNNCTFDNVNGSGHAFSFDDALADAAYQARGVGATLASGGGSPDWPAHAADDIGILLIANNATDAAPTFSVQAGFTLLDSAVTATGGAGDVRLSVYWKRATSASETDPTVNDTGTRGLGVIATIRGARTTGDFWDAYAMNFENTEDTSFNISGVTTLYDGQLMFAANAAGGTVTNSSWDIGGETTTERYDTTFLSFATANDSTKGAVSASSTMSASHKKCGLLIAIASEESEYTLTNVTLANFGADAAADAAIDIEDTTGAYVFNISGGTTPTVKTDGAAWRIVQTADLTLTGLVNPTEVRIFDAGTQTEIDGTEDITTGTDTWSIDSATYPSVDIRIITETYINQFLESVDMSSGDVTIPIVQIFDRNYANP